MTTAHLHHRGKIGSCYHCPDSPCAGAHHYEQRKEVWNEEVLNQGESSVGKDRRRPAVTGSWRGLEEREAMLVGLFW